MLALLNFPRAWVGAAGPVARMAHERRQGRGFQKCPFRSKAVLRPHKAIAPGCPRRGAGGDQRGGGVLIGRSASQPGRPNDDSPDAGQPRQPSSGPSPPTGDNRRPRRLPARQELPRTAATSGSRNRASEHCNRVQQSKCAIVHFCRKLAQSQKTLIRAMVVRLSCMFVHSSRRVNTGFVNRWSSVRSRPLAPIDNKGFTNATAGTEKDFSCLIATVMQRCLHENRPSKH